MCDIGDNICQLPWFTRDATTYHAKDVTIQTDATPDALFLSVGGVELQDYRNNGDMLSGYLIKDATFRGVPLPANTYVEVKKSDDSWLFEMPEGAHTTVTIYKPTSGTSNARH